MKLLLENLEMMISPDKATELLNLGTQLFESEAPLSEIPPWYDAFDQAIICLAYGGYIRTLEELED